MPQKRNIGAVQSGVWRKNTDGYTRTGRNAHQQGFRGAIRERHQVSAADPSDLNGSSSNVLAFDSKKNLESESWWRDSKRDDAWQSWWSEWQQMEWLVKVESRPLARTFAAVHFQIVSDDIMSRPLQLCTNSWLCPPESLYWRADAAQYEAQMRSAPVSCFQSCKMTNPVKNVGHLARTARKRRRKSCSFRLSKTQIRSLDRWNGDGRYEEPQPVLAGPKIKWKRGMSWVFDDHIYNSKKEEKERYKQIYVLKKKTPMVTPTRQERVPFWAPSSNPRTEKTDADAPAPSVIPKPNWQEQQQQGSRVGSHAPGESETDGWNPTRQDRKPESEQMHYLVSVEPGPMALILENNHFISWRKTEGSAKDGNLSVTDGCVNSTLSGSAHFLRLRTPGDASAHSLIFLAWLKPPGIDNDSARSLLWLTESVHRSQKLAALQHWVFFWKRYWRWSFSTQTQSSHQASQNQVKTLLLFVATSTDHL